MFPDFLISLKKSVFSLSAWGHQTDQASIVFFFDNIIYDFSNNSVVLLQTITVDNIFQSFSNFLVHGRLYQKIASHKFVKNINGLQYCRSKNSSCLNYCRNRE